jgi:hypothetical protein
MSNPSKKPKKQTSDARAMNSRRHLDRIATLRLSLQSLDKEGDLNTPSVAKLRQIIQDRIAKLEQSPRLQLTAPVLDVPCPVCQQPPGLSCISIGTKSRFDGKKILMRQPHRQRFGQPIRAEE